MRTDLFDYELPEALIAHAPADKRDASRLMVVDRKAGTVNHTTFSELPQFLPQNTTLFRNNACVFKARLHGKRTTGGQVECLLLQPGTTPHRFWCLLKPGKKLPPGSTFSKEGHFEATVLEKRESGQYLVEFSGPSGGNVIEIAEKAGELPLPPYIERKRQDLGADLKSLDNTRYQTVYANPDKKVAAAAPTAGLHFTPEMLQNLQKQGVAQHEITLHIGLDTFRPIQADNVEEHIIHREIYEIPPETQSALLSSENKTRLAVGTTSLRAIEDYFRKTAQTPLKTGSSFMAEADIFLYPPAPFQGVEALITNFHLPRSTLVCLVSAFLTPEKSEGIKWLKELYQLAIDKQYRFYSYGDAMLIL